VAELSVFPVDSERLQRLAATRGGRVALGGFECQRAFAVLRLVSMLVGQAVKGTTTEVQIANRRPAPSTAATELAVRKLVRLLSVFCRRSIW
jgi:hypothetical protein